MELRLRFTRKFTLHALTLSPLRTRIRCMGNRGRHSGDCSIRSLAEAAGVPVKIDHSHAFATRQQLGNHLAGWFQFQPLLARITRDEPDLLD
jgi:hypothetical protein